MDDDAIDKILATRNLLKTSLETSKAISSSLHKTNPKLKQNLPPLQPEITPCLSKLHNKSLEFRHHVDLALGPAAAVLKVFESIQRLEKLILSEPSDLPSYITATVKLEEALQFLASNCTLAIQWLHGVAEFVTENCDTTLLDKDLYTFNMKMSLQILQELKGIKEHARSKGGILYVAFEKLGARFKEILMEFGAESSFPENVLRKLQSVVERLNANYRIKSVFVEVRSINARKKFHDLGINDYYLEETIAESEFQEMEDCIVLWGRHLELALNDVLDVEYKLCKEVFGFGNIAHGVWMDCFTEIAIRSGILSLLQFGMSIADSKKDPIKLLNLLQVFEVLDTRRMDFNRLFGGEACAGIRDMTRDLIRKVLVRANDIFFELPLQVVLQRQSPAPGDGAIPRLVTFVTNYSNELLGDKYRPILTNVLRINQMWKNEKYEEGVVTEQIYCVMMEIAVNLDVWAKSYQNAALSYIFMMNNHCHFHKLEGTMLGDMMGESWLSGHGQYKDYYVSLFLKLSWGKLVPFLNQENPIPSSPFRTSSDLFKKRLKEFNEAFEGLCRTQAKWVVPDEELRQKICQLLIQTFVPAYKSFLLNCTSARVDKHVKYSAGSMENMISAMFRPKMLNYGSMRDTDKDSMQNVLRNQTFLPLAAM